MNFYELASQVSPDELGDHQSRVIWSRQGSGRFAYLIRIDDCVFMRVSGCTVQLAFYTWTGSEWRKATLQEYEEVVDVWQTEIK